MPILPKYIKTLSLAFFLMALILCAWFFQYHMQTLIISIKKLGFLAPVLFIIFYCLATLLLLPTMVLTLAGGAIFGPIAGTIFNLIGATLGASFAFLISRYLAYNWFKQRRGKRMERLISGVNQRGWQFIALLRLIPVIPFNLVNYGLGITGIGFWLYVLITFIFLIPAEIIYTYCGYAGLNVLSNTSLYYKNTAIVIFTLLIFSLSVYKFKKMQKMALTKSQTSSASAVSAQD